MIIEFNRTIPTSEAVILWADDDHARVSDVRVVRLSDHAAISDQRYSNARGAIELDWNKGFHNTPLGVFASMLEDHGGSGFAESDSDSMHDAAVAFGTITECQWARDLVAAFKVRKTGLYSPMEYIDDVMALFALDKIIDRAKEEAP